MQAPSLASSYWNPASHCPACRCRRPTAYNPTSPTPRPPVAAPQPPSPPAPKQQAASPAAAAPALVGVGVVGVGAELLQRVVVGGGHPALSNQLELGQEAAPSAGGGELMGASNAWGEQEEGVFRACACACIACTPTWHLPAAPASARQPALRRSAACRVNRCRKGAEQAHRPCPRSKPPGGTCTVSLTGRQTPPPRPAAAPLACWAAACRC